MIDKSRLIEWNEPYDSKCKYNLICRMTVGEVIDYQMNREDLNKIGLVYTDEQHALDDFMVIRWAHFVDEDKQTGC